MQHRPLTVLRLRGTQRDMGRQHGELAEIDDLMDFYRTMPARLLFTGRDRIGDRVAARALQPLMEALLHRLERRRPADLRERTLAFGEATGASARSARYVAVMDLFQNFVAGADKLGLVKPVRRAAMAMPGACSSIAAWGTATTDGRLLHGRNFDFPGIGVWDARPALVYNTPDSGLRYAFATARGADVPGVTAFNEAGITLTCHTRFHRDISFSGALVSDIGHEMIRRARTLDEAIDIARSMPSASTWAMCVSSGEERRAVVLELTASGVEVIEGEPGTDFVATTNRMHHPRMQVDEVTPSPAWVMNCDGRFRALQRRGRQGQLDVAAIRELLGSQEDPEVDGERACGGVLAQPTSVQSIVSDPCNRTIWLTTGPAPTGRGVWVAVPWSWDGPDKELVDVPTTSSMPSLPGHTHLVDAVRLQEEGAPAEHVEAALRRAASEAPDDPTYRFLTGAFRLRAGDVKAGLRELERGLEHERAPFHRGQLLLWAARARDAQGLDGSELRRELLEMRHPLLVPNQAAALREMKRPFPVAKMRGMPVSVQLVDCGE